MEDITPQKPQDNNQAPAANNNFTPSPQPPTEVPTAPSPSPSSIVSTPTPAAPAPEPVTTEEVPATAPATTETSESAAPVDAIVPTADTAIKPKRSAMPMVVLLVTLIVLGLSAAAYFAFVKNDTAKPAPATTTTKTTTTADPDEVSEDIDSTISELDDTKDYDSNGLSDTTLGL